MDKIYPSIPILQYDLYGNLIREWNSALTAASVLKISYQKILQCTNHKKDTYHNCLWRKKDEPLPTQPVNPLF